MRITGAIEMKTKKSINWILLSTEEKAAFIGKNASGFNVVSEKLTPAGVIEVIYSYDDWNFNCTALIVPILDSGYCQVICVDR